LTKNWNHYARHIAVIKILWWFLCRRYLCSRPQFCA